MIRCNGMTLRQFNETIEQMRTIYSFSDNNTRLMDLEDLRFKGARQVEIITKDERTGIDIIMRKIVERDEND